MMTAALRTACGVIVLVGAGLIATPARAGDDAAAARHHAAKGHKLAAKNDCAGAVTSFSRAYGLIHDPALLFSRAECYRKLGKKAEALKDYEQYLAELPNAPNRVSVEGRMAGLRGEAAERSKVAVPEQETAPDDKSPSKTPGRVGQESAQPVDGGGRPHTEKWTE